LISRQGMIRLQSMVMDERVVLFCPLSPGGRGE
jgi:hypothetical protein